MLVCVYALYFSVVFEHVCAVCTADAEPSLCVSLSFFLQLGLPNISKRRVLGAKKQSEENIRNGKC